MWRLKPGLAAQRLEEGKGKHVHQPEAIEEYVMFENLEAAAQNDSSLEDKIQCWQIRPESCAGTRWQQLPRPREGLQTPIAKKNEALLTGLKQEQDADAEHGFSPLLTKCGLQHQHHPGTC